MRPNRTPRAPAPSARQPRQPRNRARWHTRVFPPRTPLVLGTYNIKKLLELCELLAPLGCALKMLTDFPQAITVEETGDTFAANAALKASEQALHLGAWVLGEDSGLSVDALGGRPGVYSARYAGPGGQRRARTTTCCSRNWPACPRIVARPTTPATSPSPIRPARSSPAAKPIAAGRIRTEPAGTAGFGYDPLFEIVEYHRTFGELGLAVKRVLSHRARAVAPGRNAG